MDEKLTCPSASKLPIPRNDDLVRDACWQCPALMRQVDERGRVGLYCLLYANRFRFAGPYLPLAKAPFARLHRERLHSPPGGS